MSKEKSKEKFTEWFNQNWWQTKEIIGEVPFNFIIELTWKWIIENFEPKIAGQVEPEVKVKLADILQTLDDGNYTVSVYSNNVVDDKISESIANTAVTNFKKQLREELLSKFST